MVAIPEDGGLVDGVNFLLDGERVRLAAQDAKEWAAEAVRVVRLAPDPNPWRDRTDDEIAAAILAAAMGSEGGAS